MKDRLQVYRDASKKYYNKNKKRLRKAWGSRYRSWQADSFDQIKNHRTAWSKEEDVYIKNNYRTMSDFALAVILGRSYSATRSRRALLGFRKLSTVSK